MSKQTIGQNSNQQQNAHPQNLNNHASPSINNKYIVPINLISESSNNVTSQSTGNNQNSLPQNSRSSDTEKNQLNAQEQSSSLQEDQANAEVLSAAQQPPAQTEGPIPVQQPLAQTEDQIHVQEPPDSRRDQIDADELPVTENDEIPIREPSDSTQDQIHVQELPDSRRDQIHADESLTSKNDEITIREPSDSTQNQIHVQEVPDSRRDQIHADESPASKNDEIPVREPSDSTQNQIYAQVVSDSRRDQIHADESPASKNDAIPIKESLDSRQDQISAQVVPSTPLESQISTLKPQDYQTNSHKEPAFEVPTSHTQDFQDKKVDENLDGNRNSQDNEAFSLDYMKRILDHSYGQKKTQLSYFEQSSYEKIYQPVQIHQQSLSYSESSQYSSQDSYQKEGGKKDDNIRSASRSQRRKRKTNVNCDAYVQNNIQSNRPRSPHFYAPEEEKEFESSERARRLKKYNRAKQSAIQNEKAHTHLQTPNLHNILNLDRATGNSRQNLNPLEELTSQQLNIRGNSRYHHINRLQSPIQTRHPQSYEESSNQNFIDDQEKQVNYSLVNQEDQFNQSHENQGDQVDQVHENEERQVISNIPEAEQQNLDIINASFQTCQGSNLNPRSTLQPSYGQKSKKESKDLRCEYYRDQIKIFQKQLKTTNKENRGRSMRQVLCSKTDTLNLRLIHARKCAKALGESVPSQIQETLVQKQHYIQNLVTNAAIESEYDGLLISLMKIERYLEQYQEQLDASLRARLMKNEKSIHNYSDKRTQEEPLSDLRKPKKRSQNLREPESAEGDSYETQDVLHPNRIIYENQGNNFNASDHQDNANASERQNNGNSEQNRPQDQIQNELMNAPYANQQLGIQPAAVQQANLIPQNNGIQAQRRQRRDIMMHFNHHPDFPSIWGALGMGCMSSSCCFFCALLVLLTAMVIFSTWNTQRDRQGNTSYIHLNLNDRQSGDVPGDPRGSFLDILPIFDLAIDAGTFTAGIIRAILSVFWYLAQYLWSSIRSFLGRLAGFGVQGFGTQNRGRNSQYFDELLNGYK